MRTQTEYNKIVNYNEETKEITVLDYIFKNDSFKGATGTRFEIISQINFLNIFLKSNLCIGSKGV